MKRILLLALLAISCTRIAAQQTADVPDKIRVEGGFYAGYFQLENRGFTQFGGMMHIVFHEKWTLNYSLLFGSSNTSGFHAHTTGGLIAGLWLRDMAGGRGSGNLAFLLCCLPEGVGMYLPQRGNYTPHIAVNPLSFEYYYRERTSEQWSKLGCDVVASAKFHPKPGWKLYIAPQIAGTLIYTPGLMASRFGVKAGVTIGYDGN